jgi:hypothetical protein
MVAARTLGGTAQSTVGTAAFVANKWLYWFIPAAAIAGLRTTLGGTTNAASVRAALPRLQEVAARIDTVGGLSGQLSAEQRKPLVGIVSPSLPALNQLLDKVLAIPDVAEVLKWTIDTLTSDARCFDPGSSAPAERVGYQDSLRARIGVVADKLSFTPADHQRRHTP